MAIEAHLLNLDRARDLVRAAHTPVRQRSQRFVEGLTAAVMRRYHVNNSVKKRKSKIDIDLGQGR